MRLSCFLLLLLPQQEPSGWKQLEEALRPPIQRKQVITNWPVRVPLRDLSSPEAAGLLEKFAGDPKALGLAGPLERALAQRLLWAFFDAQVESWKQVDSKLGEGQPALQGPPKQEKPERALRAAAQLIRRLALSEAEIKALPDPYARTVESKFYPPAWDPAKPDDPFLPADLWKPDGPWVSLGNSVDKPLAFRHVGYFGGRSSFHIFIRVPAGRGAAQELVARLTDYKGNKQYDPPEIPAETQVALVEQSFVINAANQIRSSPIVEIVELRVVRNPKRRFGFGSEEQKKAQAAFRFRLRHDLLVAGDPSPLRSFGHAEEDWEPVSLLVEQGRTGGWPTRGSSLAHCSSCHSFTQAQTLGIFEVRFADSGLLEPLAPEKEREKILRWKEKSDPWKELQALWK
ncbi:MAG: hypothetical protein HY293_17915 [Planctomycetes bacterium]|nr:hypothetical protein [Planctomycetota bacterium]